MKTSIRLITLAVGLFVSHALVAQAPAGATGACKDGTYSTNATKKGACAGHKGVKEWYADAGKSAATTSTAAPAPAATPSSSTSATDTKSAPAARAKNDTSTASPVGGAGQVWVNTASNVYHCEGTRYYGKTKAGAYMSEADAKAKGARADHGKPCSK